MKKNILLLLLPLLFMGCTQAEPNLLGHKLKELSKKNDSVILNVISDTSTMNTDSWRNYMNTKYDFGFKYPDIFEVVENDRGFINLIYKGQSKNDVFMSFAPQEGKNNSCDVNSKIGAKTEKRPFSFQIITQNVPFSEGWIDHQACFIVYNTKFVASHILSIDAPSFESTNFPKAQSYKINDLKPEELKSLEELKRYHEKTDKILEDIKNGTLNDLTKREIALFDKIISTLSIIED